MEPLRQLRVLGEIISPGERTMRARSIRATFALACLAVTAPAFAQTVVGRDSSGDRYNRLREYSSRAPTAIAPASPDVFGTAAVGAGVTFYDARFRRVANADRDHPILVEIAGQLRGLPAHQQLAIVKSE